MSQRATNWFVLTGGPSSGITSLCHRLALEGLPTMPEVARMLIDESISTGITVEELRRDDLAFTREVLRIVRRVEEMLDPEQLVFLERGVLDAIGFGLAPQEVLPFFVNRYKKVFLLQQVGFVPDYARTENPQSAKDIERGVLAAYQSVGYEVVVVPPAPIQDRLIVVLSLSGMLQDSGSRQPARLPFTASARQLVGPMSR